MASRTVWPRVARLSRSAHSTIVQHVPLQQRLRASVLDRPAISRWTAATAAPVAVRYSHSIPRPPRQTDSDSSDSSDSSGTDVSDTTSTSTSTAATPPTGLAPHYELTFTCVPCGDRSSHRVSKQGYHQGSVLITCPSCRNRHVITDHLGIFGGAQALEDILRERGQLVKRGTLGEDGDIEFWEDGTESRRQDRLAAEAVVQPRAHAEGGSEADAAPGSTFGKAE